MFGLGRPARPEAVAFDIIGTVFSLEPLRPLIIRLGLPPAGLEGWFAAGCRDAFAISAAGDFEPFSKVLESALDQVLAEQRLDPLQSDRKALVEHLESLDARADARSAFEMLNQAGIPVLALSNGAKSSTRALLTRAALDGLVQHIVSVNEVKLAKPRPEVYRYAAERAKVEPKRLAVVAAHPWDIHGAKAAGCVAAYLDTECPYPSTMRKPDMKGATLLEIAQMLAEL